MPQSGPCRLRDRYEEDVDVGLLTIGALRGRHDLSPKALRLYDELGVLPPAAMDPESVYRLYDPAQLERAQLERAQLIARLRRIGAEAVAEADRTVRKLAEDDHQPITTLTAMLWSGSQAALVHIGDGRAYLLRGGELSQLTQDHT
jgi:MerR HTH family regulatory protein